MKTWVGFLLLAVPGLSAAGAFNGGEYYFDKGTYDAHPGTGFAFDHEMSGTSLPTGAGLGAYSYHRDQLGQREFASHRAIGLNEVSLVFVMQSWTKESPAADSHFSGRWQFTVPQDVWGAVISYGSFQVGNFTFRNVTDGEDVIPPSQTGGTGYTFRAGKLYEINGTIDFHSPGGINKQEVYITIETVPEPASLVVLGLALTALKRRPGR